MKRTKTRSTQTLNGSYWLSWSHRRLDMLKSYMTNYLFPLPKSQPRYFLLHDLTLDS